MLKLILEEQRYVYRIGCPDEEYDATTIAAPLGQEKRDGHGEPPADREGWEWWAANKAILDMTPRVLRDSTGFYWESKADAQGAMRIIKAALKQERPLPEWARTALAAGWKPPKGWKA